MLQPLRRLLPANTSASLLRLAALFVGAYALALTISPAVRQRAFEGLGQLRWAHWLGLAVWLGSFVVLHRQVRKHFPHRDIFLVPLVAFLSGWGLLTIWRLTTVFGLRQSLWVAVCTGLFILALRAKDQILPTLRRYKYLILLAGFAITALTIFFGTNPSGIEPRLWLGCCGVYFQPSEILKLLLVIYLAAYLADRQPLTSGWLALLVPTALMTGVALLLLLGQHDLGTAWVFIFIYMIMIYAAAGKRRVLVASLFILVVALIAGYELVGLVHQRVEIWINPWADPSGSGYQIVQGILAVASGGMLGRGPGMGSPGIVPVSHSDFIYTSIVEETGLVGAIALLLLISLLCLRALRISLQARDTYQRYLAIGLCAYLASQSILIIGGNIRMLPLTGVTLPFVSYGGSSLLASFIALLLLCLISNDGINRAAPLPGSRPTLAIAGIIFAAFGTAALTTGWWSLTRGPDLLTRADNARRALSDRYVARGALVDRNREIFSRTTGQRGEYQREYLLPDLANVLGYSHEAFGQSGLEAGLDGILRGEEYQPTLGLWLSHLLYGEPSPGLDVRISLDAELTTLANDLLAGQTGAAVVLEAETGEVLTLASQPGFDPKELNKNWEALSRADDSPLLNRAAQGAYPPGTTLGPFLLAAARSAGVVPQLPTELEFTFNDQRFDCLTNPEGIQSWDVLIASACPGALVQLGLSLGGEQLLALFNDLGFYAAPDLPLELHAEVMPANLDLPEAAAIGQGGLLISPLQMARAICSLSNFGQMTEPKIVLEIEQAGGGWQPFGSLAETRQIVNGTFASGMAQNLSYPALSIWELTGQALGEGGQSYTWYLAGSLADQASADQCVVVLLESDDPVGARSIGRDLLSAARD
ncbi:MAG: FtsW/RodA/SpoVE family cell cycle protein [Anaerolineales bacterium]